MALVQKRIHVVAGIIWSLDKKQLLISRRLAHLHKGGYWEFPGGKVELNESEEEALARELLEELNIRFERCEKWQDIDFDYPDKHIKLAFYQVFDVIGDVCGNQRQEWRWVFPHSLNDYSFPEANQPIVDTLVKKF